MSYKVPTLEELVQHGMQRHRAELPGTDAFLWPNTEHVQIKATAGLVHLAFQYLDWIKRQRFATEADGDELDAHGKPFGMTRNAASQAHGAVELYGLPTTVLEPGTKISRSDSATFSLRDRVRIGADGTGIGYAIADAPGAEGNTMGGATMVLTSTNLAVTRITVGADGLGGGADIEDDEAFRARLLFRMRNPPRGGAAHDYVAWALSVTGVTRVWVDPTAYGPGTVAVWFMTDGATPDGIPNSVALGDVRSFIEVQRPVTARVTVQAPIAATMNVCISGLGVIGVPMQDQIKAEIADVFRRQVQVSMPSARYVLPVNLIWQAVARVTGNSAHRIVTPSSDVPLLPGYVPVLGEITYRE